MVGIQRGNEESIVDVYENDTNCQAEQWAEQRGIPDRAQSRWPRKRRYGSLNWNLLEQPCAMWSVQRTIFVRTTSNFLFFCLSFLLVILLSCLSLKFDRKSWKKWKNLISLDLLDFSCLFWGYVGFKSYCEFFILFN